MPKSTTFSDDCVGLLFNGTAIADLAQNDTSSPATSLYIAAYTGTLTVTDDPTTNEATFGGYARVATSRVGTTDWLAPSGGITENVNDIIFPVCVSGSNLITHIKIVTTSAGAGKVLYAGQLASDRTIQTDRILRFIAGALKVKEQ